jgi:tripartite ATP-independent transporter DctM subunit
MIALLFAVFFGLILLRIPVAFALILSALAVILADGLPPVLIVQKVFEGLTPFPILAIPLFYLVGLLCNSSGFTERIMTLARSLVGRFRAGLAHVNIVASMLFAGLSGSSTADTAGIGSVLMPQMVKAGYDRAFTVAVTACSSTMGVVIPPSILMVIYGAMGNVSIGMLFLGGIVPGVMIGLFQMVLVYVLARRYGFGESDRIQPPPLLRSLRRGVLPLGVPLVIMGGIIGGVFTPTESAAVAVVYVLFCSLFVMRDLTLPSLWRTLKEGGVFIALPLLMTASAAVFGWLLSYYQFPNTVVGLAAEFGTTQTGVLLFVVLAFLAVGCFLDSVPAIIMFMPIVQALGGAAGIHPVQMGVVVILTLALGLVTPPYGVCLLVASRIMRLSPVEALPMTLLFGAASLLVILLAVLVPDLTLFLPRTFMSRYF